MQLQQQTGDRAFIARLLAIQCAVLMLVGSVNLWKGFRFDQQDLEVYYNSSFHLMQGQVPYRDFPLEYPPLALLWFVLPHLVKLGQSLSFAEYKWLFMLQNVLLSIAIAILLVQVVSRLQPKRSSVMALRFYLLLVVISAPMLLWRYDLFPALLTQLALLCVLVGRPTQSGIWLGFGIAAKLYPVVLLPIFSTYYLVRKKYRALFGLLLGSVGATCLTLLPFALMARGELLSFLRYHEMRGLQIETLPAGAILLMHVLGLTKVKLILNYGAFHLVSPLADSVVKWVPFVFILAFLGVIASCLVCFRRDRALKGAISDESLVAYVVAALLTFMVTGKVFSTQYIIWLLPFVPLLRPRQMGMAIIIFAITIIIFPVGYDRLLQIHALPVLLLNLRNILMVILLLSLLVARFPTSAFLPIEQRHRHPERSVMRR